MKDEPVLEVTGLSAGYGAVLAIREISLRVGAQDVVCLLGPNGAGKTTTLRALVGLISAAAGEIRFNGRSIRGSSTERLVKQGLVMVPEGREVLATMSVQENLELGAYVRSDGEVSRDLERMFELFPVLRERRHLAAGNLSGGEQQMLAIGRALMARPQLLLLDEPSLGLAPLLVQQVFEVLGEIKRQGLPILLVEQNTRKALEIADYGFVIRNGSIVREGPAAELKHDRQLVEAYLA
ncbi:MAG: ABC transporter ATP-binding protein [Chloroflexota bacterium]|nr:MAG: ABC transporter ATP-binding protein [Chloroflexota bacterium]